VQDTLCACTDDWIAFCRAVDVETCGAVAVVWAYKLVAAKHKTTDKSVTFFFITFILRMFF
jgi:hypothetical protein